MPGNSYDNENRRQRRIWCFAFELRNRKVRKPAFRSSGNEFAAEMRRGSNAFYLDLDRAYLYQKRRGFFSLLVGTLTAPRDSF